MCGPDSAPGVGKFVAVVLPSLRGRQFCRIAKYTSTLRAGKPAMRVGKYRGYPARAIRSRPRAFLAFENCKEQLCTRVSATQESRRRRMPLRPPETNL